MLQPTKPKKILENRLYLSVDADYNNSRPTMQELYDELRKQAIGCGQENISFSLSDVVLEADTCSSGFSYDRCGVGAEVDILINEYENPTYEAELKQYEKDMVEYKQYLVDRHDKEYQQKQYALEEAKRLLRSNGYEIIKEVKP